MYIVYGITNKKKLLSKSINVFNCSHCGNSQNWGIYKIRSFFTLFFFLRIFPIGSATYVYICPKCKNGISISSYNLNQILSQVQMTPALSKELNGKAFKKYLAKADEKLNTNIHSNKTSNVIQNQAQGQTTINNYQESAQVQTTINYYQNSQYTQSLNNNGDSNGVQ